MKSQLIILALLSISPITLAETPLLLGHNATIPLPNVEGRFDHFSIDLQNKRLFAAALGNNSLEVIDLANNKPLQSVPNLKKPTGSAWIPDLTRLAVASSDDATYRFFDGNPVQ